VVVVVELVEVLDVDVDEVEVDVELVEVEEVDVEVIRSSSGLISPIYNVNRSPTVPATHLENGSFDCNK
jgi:hypothetical protein